jgi:glycosyltransferase involved in cell wall biosynthesis
MPSQPLVSVVTPVYNTEAYLAECIESVLAQTYSNWEYIIVDNRSTDASASIAQSFARQDERIRVVTNHEFLPIIPNWNHALRQIARESRYVKTVHADDWLFPECIEKMVEVAVANPTVGIVSAYRLNENRVDLDGLPYPSTVTPGQVIGRLSLVSHPLFLFGSPTSTLIRADLIRAQEKFYDESLLHADTDACLRLLQECDFGFVHQILTYTRRHNESMSSYAKRLETIHAEKVRRFLRYGPIYLNDTEYAQRLKEVWQGYYRMLAQYVYKEADREFWDYHNKTMDELGMPFQFRRLVRPLLHETAEALLHFKQTVRNMTASFRAADQRNHVGHSDSMHVKPAQEH